MLLFWIILFLILISAVAIGVYLDEEIFFGPPIIGIIFLGLIFVIGSAVTGSRHATDIESIEYHKERVTIQSERLQSLNNVLSNFDYPSGALLNHDSPIANIADQISDAELSISQAKESVVRTERDIRARKRWIFNFVTKWIED